MATRSNIEFAYNDRVVANVYVHYDGTPMNRIPELQHFFLEVKSQTQDTRFSDPSYLAAKFIVWYTQVREHRNGKPLDFLGIGVAVQNAADSDYIYRVHCDRTDTLGLPLVKYMKR
jgi:hypothetical protein